MLNKSETILSIVVPTKNRHDTLSVLIEATLKWKSNEFELVVQDNSSDNSALATLLAKHKSDTRLKYFFETSEMSAVENCELAIGNASGTILTLIGDDDAVLPEGILAARWMRDNEVDALVVPGFSYTWPDTRHAIAINEKYNGILLSPHYSGKIEEVIPQNELAKVIRAGARTLGRLPRLYHSFVSRQSLDRLRKKTGVYCPGPVPDMSTAVGLVTLTKKCCYVDLPIILSGVSAKSMAGQNSTRQHQGDIAHVSSLPKDTAKNWDRRIPYYWSAPTIWAETALKAAQRSGQNNTFEEFNFAWVYAGCLAYTKRSYYGAIWRAFRMLPWKQQISSGLRLPFYVAIISAERARTLFGKVGKPNLGQYFSNIAEAMESIDEAGTLREASRRAFRN